jgi:hypothetical protein
VCVGTHAVLGLGNRQHRRAVVFVVALGALGVTIQDQVFGVGCVCCASGQRQTQGGALQRDQKRMLDSHKVSHLLNPLLSID